MCRDQMSGGVVGILRRPRLRLGLRIGHRAAAHLLVAVAHEEPVRERGLEVLARRVPPGRDVAASVVDVPLHERVQARPGEVPSGVGDDDVASGSQHAGELREHRCEVLDVGQRERADHEVRAAGRQRERPEVGVGERSAGHLLPRQRQHRRRAVEAVHGVPELGEVGGVPPRATRRVDGDAGREVVEQRADRRLLYGEDAVGRVVVRRRPAVVRAGGRHGRDVDAGAERLGRVEEPTDLGDPGSGEVRVELAREGLHQGYALHAEEVGQRVLVDGRQLRVGHAG